MTIRTPRETDTEGQTQSENDGFDSTMEGLLPEYLEARQVLWTQDSAMTLPVRLPSQDDLTVYVLISTLLVLCAWFGRRITRV